MKVNEENEGGIENETDTNDCHQGGDGESGHPRNSRLRSYCTSHLVGNVDRELLPQCGEHHRLHLGILHMRHIHGNVHLNSCEEIYRRPCDRLNVNVRPMFAQIWLQSLKRLQVNGIGIKEMRVRNKNWKAIVAG